MTSSCEGSFPTLILMKKSLKALNSPFQNIVKNSLKHLLPQNMAESTGYRVCMSFCLEIGRCLG
jgi:hypothetical protein